MPEGFAWATWKSRLTSSHRVRPIGPLTFESPHHSKSILRCVLAMRIECATRGFAGGGSTAVRGVQLHGGAPSSFSPSVMRVVARRRGGAPSGS